MMSSYQSVDLLAINNKKGIHPPAKINELINSIISKDVPLLNFVHSYFKLNNQLNNLVVNNERNDKIEIGEYLPTHLRCFLLQKLNYKEDRDYVCSLYRYLLPLYKIPMRYHIADDMVANIVIEVFESRSYQGIYHSLSILDGFLRIATLNKYQSNNDGK